MTPEMRSVFGKEGLRELSGALRAEPLLAFDFDGTLAPIVLHPDDAQVAAVVSDRLDRLSRLRPIAVVTGRSVDDVAHRLGFTARFIVGNHGAEEPDRVALFDTGPLDALRMRVEAQAEGLRAAGIETEYKRYSLTLHYRQAANRREAKAMLKILLSDLPSTLRCIPGKCVFNIVIADAPDKFDAVAELEQRAGCNTAVFVGDDMNDESVFIRAPRRWLTVRVGRENPHSHAAFFLDAHADVVTLLDQMLTVLNHG
jgi:trehalose 6-phosphate phosphatase